MDQNDLQQCAAFGSDLIDLLGQRGWNSIPKSELTLYLFHFAQKADVLTLSDPRMKLSSRLKVSPVTVDNLLRDRALVCGSLTEMDFQEFSGWQRTIIRQAMMMPSGAC
ncbi:hypothetical protein [Desulfobulbus alkaliphilus]|uniref:hypothetical protein n=1 Tax=Desulfobulbus alkaliphilus TaxID=869814 RepID=UPI001965FE14|nr:hypothetical protein [Desulfobulbus alkaliphilus]MBM9538600.1 hypothetical protein [Desulfobulbus alkaliphilus]